MTTLSTCSSCSRHIRADEARCPFCGAARASTGSKLVVAATLVSLLSIAACGYGLPTRPDAGVDAAVDARAHAYDAPPHADASVHDAPKMQVDADVQ
jgi:hypothetical protein